MNRRKRRYALAIAIVMCMQCFFGSAITENSVSTAEPPVQAVEATAETKATETAAASAPTEAPAPVDTTVPTETPAPTDAPVITDTPAPTDTPLPSATAEATALPEASHTPEATADPSPSESPTVNPDETITPNPSDAPTESPAPQESPAATDTIAPDCTPDPSLLPEESETHTPEIEDQNPEDTENPDATLEPAERDPDVSWEGVVPSDERGMAIPMLFQTDYPQVVCTIRGLDRSVASSGCAATSLSMVIAYLTGNTDQNPYSLFCEAMDDGRYVGAGWSHDTLSHYARAYGLKSKWIPNRADDIIEALQDGKPIIAHMGPGLFTTRGHYLVLRGITEDGLILMNDPNSRKNCGRAFPITTLLKQVKTSHSFMVCWVDEEAATPEPTLEPTLEPTIEATIEPTIEPTIEATIEPTLEPTIEPTLEPTIEPTLEPTIESTIEPTPKPIAEAIICDVNGSGSIDMNDVQFIYDVFSGYYAGDALTQDQLQACDLNGDGRIDVCDLRIMIAYVREGKLPEIAPTPAPEPSPSAEAEPTVEPTVEPTEDPPAEFQEIV